MESSNLIPTPEEGPNRLHALPTGLVDNIIDFLIIEPDVTASDQTAQRRQNLSIFSLVCRRFDLIAKRDLYRIVRISTARGLRLFLRTVRSRPGTARLVEQLSLDLMLCGNIAAGPENHKLCLNMYWTLKCVTRLWVLSLRLMECNCCFRNSGLQDVAVNGANVGYDNFYERMSGHIRDDADHVAGFRTLLPDVRHFHFASTEIPFKYRGDFALRGWNVLGPHGTQQHGQ